MSTSITLTQAIAKLNQTSSGQPRINPLVTADAVETIDAVSAFLEAMSAIVGSASPEGIERFASSRAGAGAIVATLDMLSHSLDVARELLVEGRAEKAATATLEELST